MVRFLHCASRLAVGALRQRAYLYHLFELFPLSLVLVGVRAVDAEHDT